MYSNVRTYRVSPGDVDRLMHAIDESFVPELSNQPGFVAYQAIDAGGGALVTITTFRAEADAANSAGLAKDFIARELSDVDLERTNMFNGAVAVSQAVEEVLEPAHAGGSTGRPPCERAAGSLSYAAGRQAPAAQQTSRP